MYFMGCGSGEPDKNITKINYPSNESKELAKADTGKPVEAKKLIGKSHKVKVIRQIKHDPKAYTQGLLFYNGYLYESTGQYLQSSVRIINPETGDIVKKRDIAPNYFGEGMALLNNKLYQITWRSRICLVHDPENLNLLTSFNYFGEGWGLTNYADKLIMSNGSNEIKFIDPKDFSTTEMIWVYDDDKKPLINLNELEYINGEIFANIYMRDRIVRIDPSNGNLLGSIDISSLRSYLSPTDDVDVLNGIAYDKHNDRYFLTGKNWPYIFEVIFEPVE